MALQLGNEDLNGECFVIGAEGEVETEEASQILWMPLDNARPQNWAHGQSLAEAQGVTNAQANPYLTSVLWLNYKALIAPAIGRNPRDAFRISYLRMLVVREGLVDPNAIPNSHHARYNLARFAQQNQDDQPPAANPDGADANWMRNARLKFTNMVCITAYFFRVRGHHFQDSFEDRFKGVWRKCLYNEDEPGLRWEFIARDALHAIFPDDLDDYWVTSAENSACAGALVKRVESAPAGVAGVAALRRGLDDITMILPKVVELVPDAIIHLKQVEDKIAAHRWNGSVNRRFYGAEVVRVDESRLGSLAAVIIAALEQFAGNNPLSRSNALKRIAANAPLTGAIIARLIATAVNDPKASSALLIDINTSA